MSQFVESLESRQLLSAAPVRLVNPTIAADLAAIRDDAIAIRTDRVNLLAKLAADKNSLVPTRAADLVQVRLDRIQLAKDHGNPIAVPLDQAKLAMDQATYLADAKTIVATVREDVVMLNQTFRNDVRTLVAARAKYRSDLILLRG